MNKLKYLIKLILAYILYYTRILSLIKFLKFRQKAVVLTYHRVLTYEESNCSYSNRAIIVEKNTFEKQLKFLRRAFNVISLSELEDRIKNKTHFDDYSCFITFDDGWKDNYVNAFPLLTKFNLPAAIFLSAGFIGQLRIFWQEQLNRCLALLKSNPHIYRDLEKKNGELIRQLNLKEIFEEKDKSSRKLVNQLVSELKLKKPSIRQKIIDLFTSELEVLLQENNTPDKFLKWEDVHAMAEHNITFGSHGVNHLILTELDNETMCNELKISKQNLEGAINSQITSISYPNGNFNESVIHTTKESGYSIGFTTQPGTMDIHTNHFKIPRINIHQDVTKNVPMYYCRLLGIF